MNPPQGESTVIGRSGGGSVIGVAATSLYEHGGKGMGCASCDRHAHEANGTLLSLPFPAFPRL